EVGQYALPIMRREGEVGAERLLLMSYGEVLTALGRREEAAQAWRRLLSLINGPRHAEELLEPADNTNGTVAIERIRPNRNDLTDEDVPGAELPDQQAPGPT